MFLWASTVPIVYFFLYFSFNFPEEKKIKFYIHFLAAIPVLAVFFLVLFLGILDRIVFIQGYKGFVFSFPSFYFYSLYIIGYFAISFIILFKKYFQSVNFVRVQLALVITGTLISASAGVIFGLFMPLAGNFKFYWLSPGLTMALTVFTAYAILRHRLFEIKVILTEILVGVMGIVLICMPFLTTDENLRILMSFVFLFYCLIGYLLVSYTLKETKSKEILEQKVKERTNDLEQSKKVAEERAQELERWYKLTIGREVRMAELKEKIKKMEENKK